jgi:hypothetical protein
MDQTIRTENGDIGSDLCNIATARLSSHSIKTLRFRLPARETPNRPSLLPTSTSSSASSSSIHSSLFDNESSTPGTPLTPPETGEQDPLSSLRSSSANSQKSSTLSSRANLPKRKSIFEARNVPLAETSTETPSRPSTPDPQDQKTLGTVDNVSSESSPHSSPSPVVQRQFRRKIKKEPATSIEALTARVELLNIHSDDDQHCLRSDAMEGAVGTLALKPLVYENVSSRTDEDESDLQGGDSDAASMTLAPATKTQRKKAVEDVSNSSMAGISGSDEAYQQSIGESFFEPTARLTKNLSKPKRSTILPSPNASDIGVSFQSVPPEQPNEGINSPSAPRSTPAPKSTKRAPRKASNSASKLRKSELKNDCGTPAKEHIGLSKARGKETVSRAETTINAPNDPAIAVTKFERFDEAKSSNEVKLEVLRILRRIEYECKLNKAFLKALDPKPPSLPFIDMSEGSIYIFKSAIYPGYVKIGKTKQRPEKRITQWEKQCKFTCIHISDPNDKFFVHYGMVEQLVQAELTNERRKFKCKKCGTPHKLELGHGDKLTEHGEWYEISETRALEVVEKWRGLIVQGQPYFENGTQKGILRDPWKWKCRKAMGKKEVDWEKWVLFDWFDMFWFGLYCVHAQLTALSPAITTVVMFPGLVLLVLPILCFFGSRSLIVGAIAGFAIAICMTAFRFLCC